MKRIALFLLLLSSQFTNAAYTQLSRIPIQYQDPSSNNASGYLLCAYEAGTTTPTAMYNDNAGTSAGTSITLDSDGYPTSAPVIWLDNTQNYKFKLISSGTCASGTAAWTVDNIIPEGKGDSTLDGNYTITSGGANDRTLDIYNSNGGLEIQVDGATGDVEFWNTNSSGAQEDQLIDCPRNSGNSYCAFFYNNSKVAEGSATGFDVTGALTASGALSGTTGTFSSVVSIDDTTTSTSATTGSIHTDGGLGVAGTTYLAGDVTVASGSIYQGSSTGGLTLSGGSSAVLGGNFVGYAESHSVKPGDIELKSDATVVGHWDESEGAWTFTGNALVNGLLAASGSSELTIATGVITVTNSDHTIDTESDAASDDVDTISGGISGAILLVQAENNGRTVVLKDGTGNIQGPGDCSLTHTNDIAMLRYNGTNWIIVACADNDT